MVSEFISVGSDDQSLAHRIYESLQDRIMSGDLPPGVWLRERELAEQMNVSRVPVREALRMLEVDTLVEILPRRGAVVTQLTIKDVRELFDVRQSLEVLAARLAARAATESNTAGLRTALEHARIAQDEGDDTKIAAANANFHEALHAMSDNQLLQSLMRPVLGRMRWLFRVTTFRAAHGQFDEHQHLFDAISSGDEELAAALAYAHVARGAEPSIDALRAVLPEV